jgi:hypothetical protein
MRISTPLKRATVVAALAHLAGCVTNSGGEVASINPVASTSPAATAFSLRPPKPGFGVAYVGRPGGFNASVFPVPIELDGQSLASIGPGKYLRVELSPGPHVISAEDGWWSRSINGKPYPASLTVEPGKVYYLLPKRWLGPPENNIAIIGNAVIPHQTVRMEGTFSVQASAPGAPPRRNFRA